MSYAPFDLRAKTVLVTGANSGIGFGMAEALAQAGAKLVIWGRRADRNQQAAEALRRHGGEVYIQEVDISSEAEVDVAMADAIAWAGRIDAIFANAGRSALKVPFHELDAASMRDVINANQFGTFFTMRAGVKHMRDVVASGGPPGSLVMTGSSSMLWGALRNTAYAMTKGAIDALTRSLAVEVGGLGIRVNCLLPGAIESEFGHDVSGTDYIRMYCTMKRPGLASELGGIAVYLASDASSYHTGTSIVIDGGLSIHRGG